jgi:hypothetical protein
MECQKTFKAFRHPVPLPRTCHTRLSRCRMPDQACNAAHQVYFGVEKHAQSNCDKRVVTPRDDPTLLRE